jgi:hypothetical protein
MVQSARSGEIETHMLSQHSTDGSLTFEQNVANAPETLVDTYRYTIYLFSANFEKGLSSWAIP